MAMVHFLLIYDLKAQNLIASQSFNRADDAAAAYAQAEADHRDDTGLEIVLVGADSIETVQQTHSHYFGGKAHASPYLAGV